MKDKERKAQGNKIYINYLYFEGKRDQHGLLRQRTTIVNPQEQSLHFP